MHRALICLLLLTFGARAEIIPTTNRITWQGYVGVPGGIPHRTTIFTNMLNIDSNGTANVYASLQAALTACPSNQVVLLPAGIFSNKTSLVIPTGVTLRGAGPTLTTIAGNITSGDAIIQFGAENDYEGSWFPTPANETSLTGGTKDATTISVTSATGFSVGKLLLIDQHNISGFVDPTGGEGLGGFNSRSNGVRSMKQIVEITAVSGTDITLSHPLVYNFTNSPKAIPFTASAIMAGLEDLKVSAYNGSGDCNFQGFLSAYCWIRRVDSDYADGDHAHFANSFRCEIRDSYFHDGFSHGPGSTDDCLKITSGSSFFLIENNIMRRLHCGIMMWGGGSGHVFGYNYITNTYDAGSTVSLYPDIDFHGAHPIMILAEGNVASLYNADGTWGTASHGTAARNFFSGQNYSNDPDGDDGREGGGYPATESTSWTKQYAGAWAVNLAGYGVNTYFNLVGNRLGTPTMGNYPSFNPVRKVVYSSFNEYDHEGFIIRLGYKGIDDGGDPQGSTLPSTTLIDHANYDAVTATITYDAGIADHTVPNSYYLASEPSWFTGTWPFDANGLAALTNVNAVNRWYNFVASGDATDLFEIANESSGSGGTVTLGGGTISLGAGTISNP